MAAAYYHSPAFAPPIEIAILRLPYAGVAKLVDAGDSK
jgi:hypothetical protein